MDGFEGFKFIGNLHQRLFSRGGVLEDFGRLKTALFPLVIHHDPLGIESSDFVSRLSMDLFSFFFGVDLK